MKPNKSGKKNDAESNSEEKIAVKLAHAKKERENEIRKVSLVWVNT